ncbi:MAG: hypothetical protein R3D34_05045 [Nitratireductor sp.]
MNHGGLLDVERFMKHYFLMAKEVGDLTLIVAPSWKSRTRNLSPASMASSARSASERNGSRELLDFINDNGRINVADEKVFERDRANMITCSSLPMTMAWISTPRCAAPAVKVIEACGPGIARE